VKNDVQHMTKPARTARLSRDERTSHIIAITREMVAEMGHEAIVTAEVARRCGISEAMIYKIFESKRDLLIQAAVQWFEEMLREYPPRPKQRGAFEALRQVVWYNLSVVHKAPALSRFVLLELRPDPRYRTMPIFEINRRITSHVNEVLKEGVASGELRRDVPITLLRDMIFGAIEHQTWAFLRGEGDFSVEDVADGIATVVYRGMRADARPGTIDDTARRLDQIAGRLERALAATARSRRST
jgi:AcrR family transcriptional regulator